MPAKSNHRAAFTSDPQFIARLAKQGLGPTGEPLNRESVPSAAPSLPVQVDKPQSKATARLAKVRVANMDGRLDTLVFDPVTGSLYIALPGAILLGLNVMLRLHHAKGTALKATWRKRIEALSIEQKSEMARWLKAASYPIIVEEVYVTPENNLLDTESVAASCKGIIDALVVCGFLPDDSLSYISHPIAFTERGSRPGLYLRLKPSPKPWGLIDDSTMAWVRGH